IVEVRDTVAALGVFAGMAVFALRLIEVDEAADEQIKTAVVVVIEPDGAGSPSRRGHAGFLGNVSESAVAVITVKNALAVLRDVEIGEAVPVVVADSSTLPVSACGDTGFLRHVCERAIAVVVVKRVAQRRIGRVKVARTAVDEVEVHPAVVVVIEKGAAGTRGLGKVLLRGLTGSVLPGDAALRRGHFFERILSRRKSVHEARQAGKRRGTQRSPEKSTPGESFEKMLRNGLHCGWTWIEL